MNNEIKVVDISTLKPHPQNDKIYDMDTKLFRDGVESLKMDISNYGGLREPLVINSKNIILSGHRRFLCLKELGKKRCRVRVENPDNELEYLIGSNLQRVKSDEELSREIKIIGEQLLKGRSMGRPKTSDKSKPKGSIRKQTADILGITESKVQSLKRKEVELQEIKMHDEKLYNKVKPSFSL